MKNSEVAKETLKKESEAILDAWVEAKQRGDFKSADRMRRDLRARGIEPDLERPPKFVSTKPKQPGPKAEFV